MAGFDSVLGLVSVLGSCVVAALDSVFGLASDLGSCVVAGFDSVFALASVLGSRAASVFVSVRGLLSAPVELSVRALAAELDSEREFPMRSEADALAWTTPGPLNSPGFAVATTDGRP